MKNLGIYVHIPFCKERCNYCDFLSFRHVDYDIDPYLNALLKEIDMVSKLYNKYLVDTIFFGGGTPSYFTYGYISKIMNLIRNKFNISNNPEISIEVNPNTLSIEKIREYKESGINRISLAIQSFDENILKILGRDHNPNIAINEYNDLRKEGFNNISFDLMMGIPGQSIDQIYKDIDYILRLKPDHISYYSLILEEKTMFNKWVNEGKIKLLDEEIERNMYHLANKELENIGLKRYEISNFSLEGFQSKHNLKYWNLDEYLGIGLGSSSYIGGYRFSNTRSFNKYIKDINEDKLPRENIKKIDLNESYMEYIMLKSRLVSGIDINQVKEKYNIDLLKKKKKEIKKLEENGLIYIEDNRILLSEKGFDLDNQVVLDLI